MEKYTDDEIRAMPKITIKIAADYLGISTNLLTLGMRNNVLPIGFAVKNEDAYLKAPRLQRKSAHKQDTLHHLKQTKMFLSFWGMKSVLL